jgi:hypothetical protein
MFLTVVKELCPTITWMVFLLLMYMSFCLLFHIFDINPSYPSSFFGLSQTFTIRTMWEVKYFILSFYLSFFLFDWLSEPNFILTVFTARQKTC